MWHGLLKIIEIKHFDKDGNILWEAQNLKNILHDQGEQFILNAAFINQAVVPTNYYFGLDSRVSPSIGDTLSNLYQEPTTNSGYVRVAVASSGQFTLTTDTNGDYMALSPIIIFWAQGTTYTAKNLFLATSSDNSGLLISTVQFGTTLSIAAGTSVSMRMSLTLS
jgi:hypothetical protein